MKCPKCGGKFTNDNLFQGSCPKCFVILDDNFIQECCKRKQQEETVKRVEELKKAQNARDKEQREREEREKKEEEEGLSQIGKAVIVGLIAIFGTLLFVFVDSHNERKKQAENEKRWKEWKEVQQKNEIPFDKSLEPLKKSLEAYNAGTPAREQRAAQETFDKAINNLKEAVAEQEADKERRLREWEKDYDSRH